MISLELKIAPQKVKEWELIDIIDISANIISQRDNEAYDMFCAPNNITGLNTKYGK